MPEPDESGTAHCFTIGHSNHSLQEFIGYLKKYRISTLIDVRSYPVSKYQPQFNRDNIKKTLADEEVSYLFLGNYLGGLYKDPRYLFPDGTVDYEKVKERVEFKEGIQIVEGLIKSGENPALMCTEKDPFDCHRFVLISRVLCHDGVNIDHILNDGSSISQKSMEDRLRQFYCVPVGGDIDSLFKRRNRDLFAKRLSRGKVIPKKASENTTFSNFSTRIPRRDEENTPDQVMPSERESTVQQTFETDGNKTTSTMNSPSSEQQSTLIRSLTEEGTTDDNKIKLFTIGFTKKSAKQFFETLSSNGVRSLIDIRLNNRSQLAGFTKGDDLKYFLKRLNGIEYLHMTVAAPSEELLKKYQKKEITWREYEEQYLDLMKLREVEIKFNKSKLMASCLLCSEPIADQCHRRLLAEYLKRFFPDIEIVHL